MNSLNDLLHGIFNTALNWTCGILGVGSLSALVVIPETKGATYLLLAALCVFGLKAFLECIKIIKVFKDWRK